ncbi:MAG TPA: HD domain-containing phosphohydrolase [Myxococcaceae bacterium]|nr:HD domain-containing phosphohydrolase [Myxococcaceae bacterium]
MLAAEHDLDALLPLILVEAALTVEAERCTLFIIDRETDELVSKVAQGAEQEIRISRDEGIAGTVSRTGVPLNIPDAYSDPRFSALTDQQLGFRTRQLLCVPMRDRRGGMVGVIQALNRRTDTPFTEEDEELLLALGSQAAGAIENAFLHEDINNLFEGFVSASVVAIESRDPSTAGHSGRVADLSVNLAEAVARGGSGVFRDIRFSRAELRELRYAALLHDFGKVGVREPVLVKAEKLYPEELEVLKARFELARMDAQLQSYRRRMARVRAGEHARLDTLEAEEEHRLAQELQHLDEMLGFVLKCNRPTILEEGGFERLTELAHRTYCDSRGHSHPLLNERDVALLSIPKGTLSVEERREIESHVTHTYRFLEQIPWTKDLRSVPEIAYAHHEKLDGSGYPRALSAAAIPVQSKIMAISDIYDALTAADRPYKKAVPHERALDILGQEAKRHAIDGELLRIFIEAEVPRRALNSRSGGGAGS